MWPKNEIDIQDEDEEKFSSKFTFKILQDLKSDDVKNLLKKPDDFQEILGKKAEYLEKQELKIKDIESIFLPYCSIVPNFNKKENKEEKDFFAETFRRINTSGKALTDRELRRTTFWLYESIEKDIYTKGIKEFEEELKKIKTFQDNNDFLAYLAIICDFEKRYDGTMRGYDRVKKFDRYIVDFLLCCGKEEYNNIWTRENIEYIKNNQERFEEGKIYFLDFFNKKSKSKENNITYQDMYLFSFAYYIYFTEEEINEKTIANLLDSVRNYTNDYLDKINNNENKRENYSKNPNALKRIRERLLSAYDIICSEVYNNG